MPADVLSHLPDGADVFLDANIFIYAVSGLSPQCRNLLERCARGDVVGITSLDTVNEVTHRLMVAEAFQKELIAKPRADHLARKPAVVRTLTDHWFQVESILDMGLLLLQVEASTIWRAQTLRQRYGLLTLDSVLAGLLEEYGIEHLASHDACFDQVSTIRTYHPADIP
jgi:predicted nucleic acid-binding protein